jgi:chlorite dismutase
MTNSYLFLGGASGSWQVTEMSAPRGAELAAVERLDVSNGARLDVPGRKWVLQGFTSNVRYAKSTEVAALKARQLALNRPEATCAALIPIKKSTRWWDLAQDERRAIFEETLHHTAIGFEYLPAIARRLHHCRDIGEPFDFLTWFEFAPRHPRHKQAFNELVARLRATQEWEFVEREVDIRLERV